MKWMDAIALMGIIACTVSLKSSSRYNTWWMKVVFAIILMFLFFSILFE